MLYNEETWKTRGDILGRPLLSESMSEHIAKFLCTIEVLLQAELEIYLTLNLLAPTTVGARINP